MKRTILQKAAAAALFVLLTAALLAAADFLLVDDIHSYSRVMLQELYADAGNIDTLFLGSSHCYRSVDPAQVDAALGTHSFNAGSSQQLPDGSYYMLKEAAAQNPLKTVYLEMFYTGYNESASANIPLACYLLADHMDWRSPNRYAYLSEMGGLAAYADLLLPARHGIASPSSMPALWKAKLTDGYTPDSYGYVTYPDSGEAYRGRGFVYTTGIPQDGFATLLNVDADAPLSDFGWEYLNKITDFCAENDIRLVLFTAPLPRIVEADMLPARSSDVPSVPFALADDGIGIDVAELAVNAGNVGIIGSAGRGKSTILALLAHRSRDILGLCVRWTRREGRAFVTSTVRHHRRVRFSSESPPPVSPHLLWLVDDADTLFDPFGTDPLCARLKDALGDHDVTVVFAVETSKHIRIPEHCGTRIVFPTGERTVDLMDGIPAGLLSQCGPDDIMTAGRAVLLREGNALWIQCAMAKI